MLITLSKYIPNIGFTFAILALDPMDRLQNDKKNGGTKSCKLAAPISLPSLKFN